MTYYRDAREDAYRRDFADLQYPKGRRRITEESQTANGRDIRKIEIDALLRHIERQEEIVRLLQQDVQSLRGQLEYIFKQGLDAYDQKIQSIRDEYPKP